MTQVRCPSCEKLVNHGEPHTCYSRAVAEMMSLREWIDKHEMCGPTADDVVAEIHRRIEALRAGR